MIQTLSNIAASLISACFFCIATEKMLGAMQQSGYKNKPFLRWLRRKDNLFFNRLSVLALCIALSTTVTSLCFSFLGVKNALLISAIPFVGLLSFFTYAGRKYALKVPAKKTNRYRRLFAVYVLFVLCTSYILIALLAFFAEWNGSALYGLIAYAPFAVVPILLPFLLCAANAVEGIFEGWHNAKFVKRAKQVLDESEIIRVGVVGSYGKTSVKNILNAILSQKYSVVSTPESYNTPIGIAKTVTSSCFDNKQVFIAEMGARKKGDIKELCDLVRPDYAIFTGICEQHISTFGNIDSVWEEKSEILRCNVKKAVCGEGLRMRVEAAQGEIARRCVFADNAAVKNLHLQSTKTSFTLKIGEEEIDVTTCLLGNTAVENILLAATLAKEMGLTAAEISKGIEQISQVPHRLQLTQANGVYILDDGYNCNPRGAQEAIEALKRFDGKKCVVTPGIVECGVLEEKLNGELGEQLAKANFDKVILIGDTLVGAVKSGYVAAQGDIERLQIAPTLQDGVAQLQGWLENDDAVLFLNDLPDVY